MKRSNTPIICVTVLLACLFSSCFDKVVTDVKVPTIDPKLVMFTFLSPEDTVISVTLTMSQPVFSKQGSNSYDPITTAQVKITDSKGNASVVTYDQTSNAYVIDQSVYKINPSETYTVSASYNGMFVKGSTTVPANIAYFTRADVKRLSDTTRPEQKYTANVAWQDVGGAANYYRVCVETGDLNLYPDTSIQYANQNGGDRFYTDEGKDGAELSDIIDYSDYNDFSGTGNNLVQLVYLLNVDKHYFEYTRRRLNYYGDDPFSEPFPQYSNVEGGLGVISSFRKSKVAFRF